MEIMVRVHTKSHKEKIIALGGNAYEVWLKEAPVENRANMKLIKLLKKYFNKNVKIISGKSSNKKKVFVEDGN